MLLPITLIIPKEKKTPLGNELADLVSKKFLDGKFEDNPLTFASDPAKYLHELEASKTTIPNFYPGMTPNESLARFNRLKNAIKYGISMVFSSRMNELERVDRNELKWMRDLQLLVAEEIGKEEPSLSKVRKKILFGSLG